jgi:hypothetical protein
MNNVTNQRFLALKTRLENLDPPNTVLIVHDRRFATEPGRDEIEAKRSLLRDHPCETVDIPIELLRKLFNFVPSEGLARYGKGFPIVVMAVEREDLDIRQKHDRHDGDLVKGAKQALEIESFRLTGRQTGVELARNTRLRDLTAGEAEYRARQTIGVAAYRSGTKPGLYAIVPTFDAIMRLSNGLIDRGRRLAAAFFGIPTANGLTTAEKADVRIMMNARGARILEHIEQDNIGRVRGAAANRDRAGLFVKAMESWGKRTVSKKPITWPGGVELTNAVSERMTATELMKVAISGDQQPSDIHKNLLIETPRFEVGRLMGRLSRGQAIELDSQQALVLRLAIIKRGFGCLETQSDSMNFLLADAALRCFGVVAWMKTLDRIVSTGVAEEIRPQPK